MTASYDIVPIGKYKGKPIEHLMADQPYSEWLLAQAWFVDRYAELAQLLRMGRLTEPQDTPDHNAMIAGLIDQRDAMECLLAPTHDRCLPGQIEHLYCSEMHQEVEPKGADIRVSIGGVNLMIEVKPLIGDDYPSVIRQVKAGVAGSVTTNAVVIARTIEPTNLTVEQVKRQFELAGVRLILEHDFFENGREWAAKRSDYVTQAIVAISADIAGMQAQISSAGQTSGKDDEWGTEWERKREIERMTAKVVTEGDRLARLRKVGS